jgi:hypothetical protein
MSNIPTNKKLYIKIKSEAKRKFKVWPSAYASGWLVREYKRLGGKYKTLSRKSHVKSRRKSHVKSRRKSHVRSRRKSHVRSRRKSHVRSYMRFHEKININRKNKDGLSRWFAEKWIDTCKLPSIVPCGRKSARISKRKYPYCRPLYKINSNTPETAKHLSINQIRKRCTSKHKHPYKRVYSRIKIS